MPSTRMGWIPGALALLVAGAGCPLTADEHAAIVFLPRTAHDIRPEPPEDCGDEGKPCCTVKPCRKAGLICNEKKQCALP